MTLQTLLGRELPVIQAPMAGVQWFFALLSGPKKDKVKDPANGEVITALQSHFQPLGMQSGRRGEFEGLCAYGKGRGGRACAAACVDVGSFVALSYSGG